MNRCRCIYLLGVWVAALAWGGAAAADSGQASASSRAARDQTIQEAREQHRAGVAAFADRRFDEAIAAFLTADALHPSAASSFNIARAYEAKGDAARALEFYREYLRRSPKAADRSDVDTKVMALTKRVAERGVQQVTFLALPRGTAVVLDSEPIGSAPITLELKPGSHVVEFRKIGFIPARFSFELTSERALDVVATLARARTGAMASRAAGGEAMPSGGEPAAAPRTGSVTRTLGFAALGASVAALGGAVTLEVMRSNAEDEASEESDQVGFSEAYERMKSRQTMARIFAGAGGALAAIGGVLLVVASGQTERPNDDGVVLACLPNRCHATYRARF